MLRFFIAGCLFSLLSFSATAQGNFFGGIQTGTDFFIRDSTIGAANTPHYDNLKTGSNIWFDLNYANNDLQLDAGVRMDFFLNSNLHNPGTPYNALGVGRFYVRKKFKDLEIMAGHFYEQIGTGIIFRSYEDRFLGIDNALLGGHVKYNLFDKVSIRAFAGVQKDRLKLHRPVIQGFALESELKFGDHVQLLPGAGFVNRTIDQESMDFIVGAIETYDTSQRFVPKYNTYAVSAYNTLNVGNVSWYIEAAYKSHEAIPDFVGTLIDKPGNVLFTTLTYSTKGFGVTGQFKRTENFVLRTSPNEILLNGMVSYIPPTAKQNSLRLLSRYNAASQQLEELSYSLDVTMTPKDGHVVNLNYSEVRLFDNELLFREVYGDYEWRISKKFRLELGFQYLVYNQLFYEGESYNKKSSAVAYTPFAELVWKVNRKHALRFEVQQQTNDGDYGSWVYGLIEYSLAPWFSIAVSDMYNYGPNPGRVNTDEHYYSVLTAFRKDQMRFSAGFVRQVAGVVCTGGICRFEPAFNGVRLTFNTTF
jgi:hypothetical protein